jgi:hypothetical protein
MYREAESSKDTPSFLLSRLPFHFPKTAHCSQNQTYWPRPAPHMAESLMRRAETTRRSQPDGVVFIITQEDK